jgi:hypothetical protein
MPVAQCLDQHARVTLARQLPESAEVVVTEDGRWSVTTSPRLVRRSS